ncbi:peptide/nickel transport system ATP-binding protein/oligopeptide transport system ATP-binding protein [Ancylobacter sp. 3268]|uniref:ABC transporter ATP-binding protein n=1 Tax=Ancylobacter sp. 3268 TaxID=2817752 RepID=UPI00285D0135|nr:ABC transporter ATP-binding protein [Ancylobacter sp. 3268]MDR6951142.1 peptide/nickel transport system ATP-binding protein/oligopeptide transport system ATP-binding protein [Ancylobacter sp. 3268]
MDPLLEIDDLSLTFRTEKGPAHVLDRIGLAMAPGEIVGLVGESGSGKTSLARAILGVLPGSQAQIVSGRIRLDGIDMLDDAKAARDARGRLVTFVPQDPFESFNPLFRVGTQLADIVRYRAPPTAGHLLGRSRRAREAMILDMLAAVQLPASRDLLNRYPHQLSGGQRQRLMIAMALLPQPRLLVADEPTAALDVTVQVQILGLLRRIAAERTLAILFTTHDLGAAWEICDRVLVMYAGQIVEILPRKALFAAARHPYTRMLLASLPKPGHEAVGIPGESASPLAPPPGCRFNPRCPRASRLCRTVRPLPSRSEEGHVLACHHPMPTPS